MDSLKINLYRRFIFWLTQTKFYEKVLLGVIPFIRFTTYYTSFRGYKYHQGYKKLLPGHIILTTDKKKLSSVLIPGNWSHAGLCVGKDGVWEVSEMTSSHYVKSCFFDLCKEADHVVILDCPDWDDDYKKLMIEKCKSFEGAKYDIQFELGVKALYCSELVYLSDFEKRLKVSLEDLAGIGREYISPNGLYNAKNVSVVWDSDELHPPFSNEKGFPY